MSGQWCVKFKRKVRGFDPYDDSACPDHAAVARMIKNLDFLANAQRWRPLTAFVSEDPDVAIDLLDEEDEDEVKEILARIGKVRWFDPKEALATVDNLIFAIEQLPRRLCPDPRRVPRVINELRDIQMCLTKAVEKEVPFRFYTEFG